MTKAELDYGRWLMAETNSILTQLDNTEIHVAINWGRLGYTAVEKVKTFSGNAAS
jgi:predicted DNA-binding WGR domain protein